MKRKLIAAFVSALMFCGNAFAMQFEQPEKVGDVGGTPAGGFTIKGASTNSGTLVARGKFKVYDKGTATFGRGEDALYFYYDCTKRGKDSYLPQFGGKSKSHLVAVRAGEGEGCTVSRLPNDSNITMYLLKNTGPVAGTTNYILLGKRDDGVFVKYIDLVPVLKQYFGKDSFGMRGPWFNNCYAQGDTVVIEYQVSAFKQGYHKGGEIRFKWDESAQWFGVEQVIY